MKREDFLKALKLEEQMQKEKEEFQKAYQKEEPGEIFSKDDFYEEKVPDIRSNNNDLLLKELIQLIKGMKEDIELIRLHTECISTMIAKK